MQNCTPLFKLSKLQTEFPTVQLDSPSKAADFIRQFYEADIEIFESSFILLLNSQQKTIGYAKISQGGLTSTVVDVRLIAKYAIDSLATNVILAHNHPSGTLTPSQADIRLTEKLKKGLELLDVNLVDHLIITAESYYSFSVNGQL